MADPARQSPQETYRDLLASVDDRLERAIFDYLAARPGESVRRETLILALFGREVERAKLASDPDDRKIRVAISNLQKRGAPILASAGTGGYSLGNDRAKLDAYIGELESRRAELDAKIQGLRRSREIAIEAQTYSLFETKQDTLFNMAVLHRA